MNWPDDDIRRISWEVISFLVISWGLLANYLLDTGAQLYGNNNIFKSYHKVHIKMSVKRNLDTPSEISRIDTQNSQPFLKPEIHFPTHQFSYVC